MDCVGRDSLSDKERATSLARWASQLSEARLLCDPNGDSNQAGVQASELRAVRSRSEARSDAACEQWAHPRGADGEAVCGRTWPNVRGCSKGLRSSVGEVEQRDQQGD